MTTFRRLPEDPADREVTVAPGITLVREADTGWWLIRHACPGVWRDNEVYISAPRIASDVVSEEPLTISPSILCLGAGLPCGLHGFVVEGKWIDAGTPPATAALIAESAAA